MFSQVLLFFRCPISAQPLDPKFQLAARTKCVTGQGLLSGEDGPGGCGSYAPWGLEEGGGALLQGEGGPVRCGHDTRERYWIPIGCEIPIYSHICTIR